MNKPPLKLVQNIQDWLFDYLDTEVDPYDFGRYLMDWAKEERVRGIDRDTVPSDLKPEKLKKFETWLVDTERGIDWLSTGDVYAPAYLFFNEVSKMPVGSWAIHFTNESFNVFSKGTTLEGLALSSHKTKKDVVNCEKNLTDDIGTAEVVFGFAFSALDRNVLRMGLDKYGRNAVLFQVDGAVRAWHIGDEEYQMVFPLCSEYNAIPIVDPRPGDIRIETEGGEEAVFGSIEDVISYVSTGERRSVQVNPSRRLVRVSEKD